MVFILGVRFTPKINAQAGQGARTGAAMEAARLESEEDGGFVAAFQQQT